MTNSGSEGDKRSSLLTLRAHLIISSSISALAFAAVMAVSVFVPLGMQLAHMDADDPAALGMAEHFMFLHSALWPLIAWSLIASITSATFLYHKMRRPLIRFAACYAALEKGEIPREITIRITDYLNGEADALNSMISALGERSAARENAVARLQGVIDEFTEQRVDEATITELKSVLEEFSRNR